jgi:hypothetical protein
MRCYVYEHWRPDTDLPFYVGKGSGQRAYKLRGKRRNPHHQNVVKKLSRLGLCVEVRLVAGNLSEDEAFSLEKERIAFWRSNGIELTNQNEGGEGGRNPSAEARVKMRVAAKKRGMPPEIWMKGVALLTGKKRGPLSRETRDKISVAKTGNVPTESRARIGEAVRLRWADPEYRARHSEANRRAKSGDLVLEGERK